MVDGENRARRLRAIQYIAHPTWQNLQVGEV
jgi:hypothetical protein